MRRLAFLAAGTASGGGLSPQLTALQNRASNPIPADQKAAIDIFVRAMTAAGLLAQTDAMYLMGAAHADAATLNAAGAQYDLTVVGGAALDDSSPRFAAGYGISGDGTGFRLTTGINPASGTTNFTASDGAMFLYSLTNHAGLAFDVGISQGGVQAGLRVLSGLIFGGTVTAFSGGTAYVAPVGWTFGATAPAATPTNSGLHYFNTINHNVYRDTGAWTLLGSVANGTFAATTALTDKFMFADGQDPFDVAVADASTASAGSQVLFWDGTHWYIGLVTAAGAGKWTLAYMGSTTAQAKAGIFACNTGTDSVIVESGKGWLGWSRSGGSSTVDVYKNGNQTTVAGLPAAGTPNGPIDLFAAHNSHNYSANQLAFAYVGGAVTADQEAVMRGAVMTLLEAFGTIHRADEDASALGGAWTRADMDQVRAAFGSGFRVYQQIRPPKSDAQDNSTFAYFPATDFGTMSIDACCPEVTSQTAMRTHHWVWDMRKLVSYVPGQAFPNSRPDYQFPQLSTPLTPASHSTQLTLDGTRCWLQYSTEAKAIAAVDVLFRYSLGLPDTAPGHTTDPLLMGYMDAARAAGFADSDVISFAYAQANAATLYSTPTAFLQGIYRTAMDKIVLPQKRLADATNGAGMILDAEAQDGRSPATTLAQLQHLAALCASVGKEFLVYPNPLINLGAQYTGFSIDSLWQLHATPNLRLCITAQKSATPIADALERQITLLKGPAGDKAVDYSKLGFTLGVGLQDGGWTDPDLTAINSFLHRGFALLMVWRLYSQPAVLQSAFPNHVLARVLEMS